MPYRGDQQLSHLHLMILYDHIKSYLLVIHGPFLQKVPFPVEVPHARVFTSSIDDLVVFPNITDTVLKYLLVLVPISASYGPPVRDSASVRPPAFVTREKHGRPQS